MSSQKYNNKYNSEERLRYLKELLDEFRDTGSDDSKEQVLANLSNFAYDPINYEHFRKLNILALFLEQVGSSSERLVEFAVAGICNCVLDPENGNYILRHGGVNKILCCLTSTSEETLLSAITALMFLNTSESHSELSAPSVVEFMHRFERDCNPRLSNLARIYLQDICRKSPT